LKSILKEDQKAEVLCHFCNTLYRFEKNELEELLESIKEDSKK